MNHISNQNVASAVNRRKFITQTIKAIAAVTILKPSLIHGSKQNSKLEVGVIGLGGRGSLISKMLIEHEGYSLVAAADYFESVVQEKGTEFGVPKERRYSGLYAYQQLIDSGVDAVFCETPPYCFPDHVAYAIKSNRHVFLAKPVACDVPGCLQILDAAKQAQTKKLTFLVDFQMPTEPFIQEVVERSRNGDIGKMGLLITKCGSNGFKDPPKTANIESRLRDLIWVNDTELGCGFIGNYDIHAIDVALRIAGEPPISAVGSSRLIRENSHGDSHDIYSVTYRFKNGLLLNHHSEHLRNVIDSSIECYAYGNEGYLETRYSGKTLLRSNKRPYPGGIVENLYVNGISRNLDSFHQEVITGNYLNATVKPSVNSTLACILGRDAAEENMELTWDEMLDKKRIREVDLDGLKK